MTRSRAAVLHEKGQYERVHTALLAQLREQGISAPDVLDALKNVPRHAFVSSALTAQAYENHPLPISHGQTISQPYIVAVMTQMARISAGSRVLEIGTGSGYQTAVLLQLGAEIFTIEFFEALSTSAKETLSKLYPDTARQVQFRVGDGATGWLEAAPFDAILVTAAPRLLPAALPKQLAEGGQLVIPLGVEPEQTLCSFVKRRGELLLQETMPVRFVPLLHAPGSGSSVDDAPDGSGER